MDDRKKGLFDFYRDLINQASLYGGVNGQRAFSRLPIWYPPEQISRFTSSGISIAGDWRHLNVSPTTLLELADTECEMQQTGARKIKDAFASSRLSPYVFFDVDHTLIDRDAQHLADDAAVNFITLEILGFIANNFEDLQNRNMRLADILNKEHNERESNLTKGLFLFEKSLNELEVREKYGTSSDSTLTQDDFTKALAEVTDPLYSLVINPLMNLFDGCNVARDGFDIQSGEERMRMIFLVLSSISHLYTEKVYKNIEEKLIGIQLKHFFDFDYDRVRINGSTEFIDSLREQHNCKIVAITRGCQLPYMKNHNNGLSKLFDEVYSSLLFCERNPEKQNRDPLHSNKIIRPYSVYTDNLSTANKVNIAYFAVMKAFITSGIVFENENELIGALGYFFNNYCRFISDSDFELYGTIPSILVTSKRTPGFHSLKGLYGQYTNQALPFSVIDRHDSANTPKPIGGRVIDAIGYGPFRRGYDNSLCNCFDFVRGDQAPSSAAPGLTLSVPQP